MFRKNNEQESKLIFERHVDSIIVPLRAFPAPTNSPSHATATPSSPSSTLFQHPARSQSSHSAPWLRPSHHSQRHSSRSAHQRPQRPILPHGALSLRQRPQTGKTFQPASTEPATSVTSSTSSWMASELFIALTGILQIQHHMLLSGHVRGRPHACEAEIR